MGSIGKAAFATLVAIVAGFGVPNACAADPTPAQSQAEQEVARLSELARTRYRQKRYLDEVIAEAHAVRYLEDAYGPTSARVIDQLAKSVVRQAGHGVNEQGVSLALMLVEKLEAIPGVPPETIPGYRALITYGQWAADKLSRPARPAIRRTLLLMESRLGTRHRDVITFRNYLFGSRFAERPFDEAWDAYEHTIESLPREVLAVASELTTGSERVPPVIVFERAISATTESLGPDHLAVAFLQGLVASQLAREGDIVGSARAAEKAIATYERQRIANPPIYAQLLISTSAEYMALGALDRAEKMLDRALALIAPYRDEEWQFALLLFHATASSQLFQLKHRYVESLELADRAKALSEDLATPFGRFVHRQARLCRFNALMGLKNHAEAISEGRALLEYPARSEQDRAWDRSSQPWIHIGLFEAYLLTGQADEARRSLAKAEETMPPSGDAGQAFLLFRKAGLAEFEGNRAGAILLGKLAIRRFQSMRRDVTRLDAGLERGFVEFTRDVHEVVASLLIDSGRLAEAQQVLALAKDAEFADFTSRGQGVAEPLVLTGEEAAWEARYRGIQSQVAAIATELDALRAKSRRGEELSSAESTRQDRLDEDLKAARIAFDKYLAELLAEFGKGGGERAIEVGEKNLDALRALQSTLKRLGHGAVAVHYLVTKDRVRILVTTPSVQVARESVVPAGDLARKVQALRRAAATPAADPRPAARELHRLLVAPIQADLDQAGAGTLMVSLDGVLRYVPFAALHDGERYLVQRYRLAMYTEAARDKLKDAPAADWRIAGLGVTKGFEGFAPLPAVREELDGIVRREGRGVLPGEVHLDQAFDRPRLRDALDRGFPVVHLATHFVFQAGTDADSYMLLGDGSRLTLREVKESNLPFGDVDLITLSACDTANFGGRDANGREVEGLGTMLQKQGARSVIATLWPVADESTALLMREFYRLRTEEKLTKAEALRRAQSSFVDGTAKSGGRSLAHPFHWAPFILMGNWI